MSNAEIIGRHIEELEDRIRLLSGDLDGMINERDSWKQNCAILENENVRIRRVINRTNATCDFYMKRFAALQAVINGVAGYITEAVKKSEVDAYGERGGAPRQLAKRPMQPSGASGVNGRADVPAFLKQPIN